MWYQREDIILEYKKTATTVQAGSTIVLPVNIKALSSAKKDSCFFEIIVDTDFSDEISCEGDPTYETPDDCTASSFLPDPDILIRTGGFQRLSNFLLYQLSYTELFFTETLWPDITKQEIITIFEKYKTIERKRGL